MSLGQNVSMGSSSPNTSPVVHCDPWATDINLLLPTANIHPVPSNVAGKSTMIFSAN